MSELFELFKQNQYRLGNCSVRVYDRRAIDLWGNNFLHHLYNNCLKSAPSRDYGILPESFCGMQDLSADAICTYLHTRSPLLLMCVDKPDQEPAGNEFDVIGFTFPTIWCGIQPGLPCSFPIQRSMVMGIVIFRPWWGTPESIVCTMLTGIYYFQVYEPLAIHGQRYPWNHLSAKFLAQFGTRDVGRMPLFLLSNGKLADCIMSTLMRNDFEAYVRKTMRELAPPQP